MRQLRFETDGATYVQGWRYRVAIKVSTYYAFRFGPRLDYPAFGAGLIELTADGAYVDFEAVEAYAKKLLEWDAKKLPALRTLHPLEAYIKAIAEAERQLKRLMAELNRVVRESIAGRAVSRMDHADGLRPREAYAQLIAAE